MKKERKMYSDLKRIESDSDSSNRCMNYIVLLVSSMYAAMFAFIVLSLGNGIDRVYEDGLLFCLVILFVTIGNLGFGYMADTLSRFRLFAMTDYDGSNILLVSGGVQFTDVSRHGRNILRFNRFALIALSVAYLFWLASAITVYCHVSRVPLNTA